MSEIINDIHLISLKIEEERLEQEKYKKTEIPQKFMYRYCYSPTKFQIELFFEIDSLEKHLDELSEKYKKHQKEEIYTFSNFSVFTNFDSFSLSNQFIPNIEKYMNEKQIMLAIHYTKQHINSLEILLDKSNKDF